MGSVIGGANVTEIAKTEGLSREQVTKVVQKNQTQIQQCYDASLKNDPQLKGRADFEWQISAKGVVAPASVIVKQTNMVNAEALFDCVKGIIGKMSFPESANGEPTTPTIGLPFNKR
jgi:hypothetical protein